MKSVADEMLDSLAKWLRTALSFGDDLRHEFQMLVISPPPGTNEFQLVEIPAISDID